MTETTDPGPLTALALRLAGEPVKSSGYVDVLPERGGKRGALEWLPHASDFEHGAGFVVLMMERDTTAYGIVEYPCSMGRGFLLTKVGGKGTDKTREAYCVETGPGEANGRCECKGFMRHSHCRHLDACQTLLLNHWL